VRYLNWQPEKDSFLRDTESKIHTALHDKMSKSNTSRKALYSGKRALRISTLKKAEKIMGHSFSGKILDAGAGDGWCSAYLCENYNVKKVFPMECNLFAVTKLIPKTMGIIGIPESKYMPILGSFNKIPKKGMFDYIVCMGALHHSSNLLKTMSELYSGLKPGGWLISQEPFMPDLTSNRHYIKKYSKMKNFHQVARVKESDRDDHFFRKCEYLVAAHHSGFDVKIEVAKKGSPGAIMLFLNKPEDLEYIPHRWTKS
jgi:SAM-dependent methyltransferase